MSSFKQFVKASLKADPQLLSEGKENLELAVNTVFGVVGNSSAMAKKYPVIDIFARRSEAEKFSEQVSSYLGSDEFLDDIDERVGRPKVGETEQEYLARAKASFMGLLNDKAKS